jgi:hypothetical protein
MSCIDSVGNPIRLQLAGSCGPERQFAAAQQYSCLLRTRLGRSPRAASTKLIWGGIVQRRGQDLKTSVIKLWCTG